MERRDEDVVGLREEEVVRVGGRKTKLDGKEECV